MLIAVRMEHTSFSKPRSSSLREKYDDSQHFLCTFYAKDSIYSIQMHLLAAKCNKLIFRIASNERHAQFFFFLQYAKCDKNKDPLTTHNRRITAPCVLLMTSVMKDFATFIACISRYNTSHQSACILKSFTNMPTDLTGRVMPVKQPL